MSEPKTRYYVLFENYEQGLALHDLFDQQGVANRIAPAPRSIQGPLTCGMALLLEEAALPSARECLANSAAEYFKIVALDGQMQAKRDKYC